MVNLGRDHWNAVTWILCHLKGTPDMTICYGNQSMKLISFVDVGFVADFDKRRSTTGYVFTLAMTQLAGCQCCKLSLHYRLRRLNIFQL